MSTLHLLGTGRVAIAVGLMLCGAGRTSAQAPPSHRGDEISEGGGQGATDQMPVPPGVEGAPYPASYGGYCYVGPHPSDPRVNPGETWDPTEGQHVRPYPPVDLRLFSYQSGCYYFIGDPHDFGYGGPSYSYYGAHPILGAYGGGWCFMIGGHAHVWAPWSPQFAVVGPWYTWHGVYDPYFWTYWPYYSAYYRGYYPAYYARGRFYASGGYRVAPPLGRGYAAASLSSSSLSASAPAPASTWTAARSVGVAPVRQPAPAVVAPRPLPLPAPRPAPRGFAPSSGFRSLGGLRSGRR